MSEISYPLSFLPLLISILQFTEDLRNLCFVFGSYWMAEKRGEVVKEGTAFASFFFFVCFRLFCFGPFFVLFSAPHELKDSCGILVTKHLIYDLFY